MNDGDKRIDYKIEDLPNYLANLVEAVMVLNEFTENQKSKGIILFDGKKSKYVRRVDLVRAEWVDKKTEIAREINGLAGKIRGWLGYYD